LKLDEVPHVTILRPVKGLEPQLYECLAATFRQTYPRQKLTIYFCVPSREDSAFPVLQKLAEDFPGFDLKILVEEEDPNLSSLDGSSKSNLGPNPKIRNLSRGYREAKGDIIWIIDCNVWVGPGVAGRMVDKLCGFSVDGKRTTPYKFVHQLPLVIDSVGGHGAEETRGLLQSPPVELPSTSNDTSSAERSTFDTILRYGGGRLEEMFMASSHAKFYTAINTVGVAPCIVGKSNMFRKSHLNALTSDSSKYSPGVDFFSENICEDHLIGDVLWRKRVPEEKARQRFYKHGLVFGDLAIQPMAGTSIKDYIARRIRWLRVRKWSVPTATLVEPGVEPFLCSAYGSFAMTTIPWFRERLHLPPTWGAFTILWLLIVYLWLYLDTLVYDKLHSGSSIELDADTPSFARPHKESSRRPLGEWVAAWMGRESLALYIWTRAMIGATVVWRGKKFRVGLDTKVSELEVNTGSVTTEAENGRSRSKDRLD
jgi:ceramide glucosyltransferase